MAKKQRKFVLTVTSPDNAGLVANIAGTISDWGGFITEANHHHESLSDTAFLRFAFHSVGTDMATCEEMTRAFLPIAKRYGASYSFHDATMPMNIVIAVSKFGHCLFDLLHRWKAGILPVNVKAVISNHDDMRDFTEWHGLPYYYLPITKETKPEQEAKIKDCFAEHEADLLVLARYMQIFSTDMCEHLSGRAINIHHSFLPSFKGAKPYHQAFERGVKMIGSTAHYVTSDLDEGPIIEQAVERVDHSLSPTELVALGRDCESVALARAVRWHAEHRVLLSDHRTVIFN